MSSPKRQIMASAVLLTFLSLTSSSLSTIAKVPQILAIWRSNSVTGINRSSLLIELWNFMLSMSYSAHFGYPLKLYAEYAGLLVQDLIILSFVIRLSQQSTFPTNRQMILIFMTSALIHVMIGIGVVPSAVPVIIITTSLPSGIIARLVQIRQIMRSNDSGNLSAMTWSLSFLTTSCRFWSNYLTVCDPLLLFRVGSAMTLNLALVIVILLYRKDKKKDL